jgi:hypothetical protein
VYAYSYIARLYITASGLSNMQTGFSLNGINFKPQKISRRILRGFLYLCEVAASATGNARKAAESRKAKLDVVPVKRRTSVSRFKSLASQLKISGSNRFYPDCLQRYIENDEFPRIQSRVFKGRTGRNAKYSISGISERKGDDLTGSIPDHAVVAHSKNNKQYRINDFFSTCFNSYCFTGLVIGAYHP